VRLVPAGTLAQAPVQPKQGTTLISASLQGNQLVIDADGPLDYQANWNSSTREYKIQFPSANLSPNFQGPRLDSNSPLDRLRLFQSEGQSVTAILKVPQGIFVSGAQRQRGNQEFSVRFDRANSPNSPMAAMIGRPPQPPAGTAPGPGSLPIKAGRPLICVDAGHGGQDPGALGVDGIQEKDINLQLALRLGRKLTDLGYQVGYTRQDDRFITLQGRVDMAEEAKADLFISLHQNASDSPVAQGIETYYLRPNSNDLAYMVHRAAVRATGRENRGVRQARFFVIRYTTMPAILLEGGYVTNRSEGHRLLEDDRQQALADAVAQSLDRFIKGKR